MNVKRISWGLLVLFVGFILLFTNLGYINFNWSAVFSLWPVLIILIGIGYLLPEKTESNYIMVFVTLGVLALFAYQGLTVPKNNDLLGRIFNDHDRNFEWDSSGSDHGTSTGASKNFKSPYDTAIEFAELSIEGGAISYRIGEPTDQLFEADAASDFSNFSLKEVRSGSKADLDFRMSDEDSKRSGEDSNDNSVIMHLNTNPIWDISLEIGAGTANFDLSAYKLEKLTIEGGVASVKARLGMPQSAKSEVDFEGGLAEFELEIPKEAACRIIAESALSSKNFDGFSKQSDGSYVLGNFDTAEKRYTIHIESGLSSVRVSQY